MTLQTNWPVNAMLPGTFSESRRTISTCKIDGSYIARWDVGTHMELMIQQQQFAPRAVLLREGETANVVFRMISGMARLSRTLPDGQRQIVGFALPGDFLGYGKSQDVIFSVEAISGISAIQYNGLAFTTLVNAEPAAMNEMFAYTVHQLSRARGHLVVLGRKNADGKLAAFLIDLRNRLFKIAPPGACIPITMTRQDIADYLGLTIETVSRTFSKFSKQNLIAITPSGICLLDGERIRIMGEV